MTFATSRKNGLVIQITKFVSTVNVSSRHIHKVEVYRSGSMFTTHACMSCKHTSTPKSTLLAVEARRRKQRHKYDSSLRCNTFCAL